MNYSSQNADFQRVAYCLLVLTSIACAVYFFATPSKQVNAQKIGPKQTVSNEQLAVATFPTSTAVPAIIPDNTPAGVTLTIPVSGITPGHVLRGVELVVSFDNPSLGPHTFLGDLIVTLRDPSVTMSHIIFTRVGSSSGIGGGDSSNMQGPYTFADLRSPTPPADMWTVANGINTNATVPSDTYRTLACCAPTAGPGIFTSLKNTFQQVALADPRIGFEEETKKEITPVNLPPNLVNGNWSLVVSDNAAGDTGRVSALSLRLITLAPTAAFASIQGRVITAGGQPISRAYVTVLNSNTVETITVQTNQFGYFTFDGLPVGTFYTMWVESGRHTFDAPIQNFTLEADVLNAVFTSNN